MAEAEMASAQSKSAKEPCCSRRSDVILPNILHAIGDTPIVRLNRIPKEHGLACDVVAKCEFINPGGSIKDRIALRMVEEAEKSGIIKPTSVLIEPTSGNTGTGLAMIAAVKGYRCILVIQEKVSSSKQAVMKALGSQVISVPNNLPIDHPGSKYNVARRLCKDIPNAVFLNQYENPNNPLTHYETTAEEILRQCGNQIDMIIIGVGTAGSISGIGRKVKERLPNCKIVGVDPSFSNLARPYSLNMPMKDDNQSRHYELEGMGFDKPTPNLDYSVVNQWVKVSDQESFFMARQLVRKEGILCGGSSGAVMSAAIKVAKELTKGQRCVLLLNDTARNYLTKHLTDSWMMARGYMHFEDVATNHKSWWKLKISQLGESISDYVSINDKISCREAVTIMKQVKAEILPVVDSSGCFKGVLNLQKIISKYLEIRGHGEAKGEALLVEHLAIPTLEFELNQTLGQLSQALLADNYAVIIQKQKMYLSGTQSSRVKRLVGFVRMIQFAEFITKHKSATTHAHHDKTKSNAYAIM